MKLMVPINEQSIHVFFYYVHFSKSTGSKDIMKLH